MRKWVDKYLSELACSDTSVRLLIADVGDFPVFRENHPGKFINTGVSESNCINVAAGMASMGLRVFVYGVSGFFLYRSYEQLKYSISYWKQPITFIGTGFGWKYFNIGLGHFTPDDIALCRLLPNVRIFTPYNLEQLKQQLFVKSKQVFSYIRITANIMDPTIDGTSSDELNNSYVIVSYGEMAHVAVAVGTILAKTYKVQVILLDEVSDTNIRHLALRISGLRVITIEDQCFYGSVACVLSQYGINTFISYLLPLMPIGVSDSRDSLMRKYKLDVQSIVDDLIFKLEG